MNRPTVKTGNRRNVGGLRLKPHVQGYIDQYGRILSPDLKPIGVGYATH